MLSFHCLGALKKAERQRQTVGGGGSCPSQSHWKKCCLSPHFVAGDLGAIASGCSCLGWVQMGFQPLVCWVQTKGLALTSYEKARGWTHALDVDVVPLSKNITVWARGRGCVMGRRTWGWSWRKRDPAAGSEHPSPCAWHRGWLKTTKESGQLQPWCWGEHPGGGGIQPGTPPCRAMHQAAEVFELRSEEFEPIACVRGS